MAEKNKYLGLIGVEGAVRRSERLVWKKRWRLTSNQPWPSQINSIFIIGGKVDQMILQQSPAIL